MRSHSLLRGSLLALVLLFGQWLNFAHDSDHLAFSSAHQSCEFCVHAQGLAPGLALPPQIELVKVAHENPVPALEHLFASAAPSYYPIRGPPSFFA